MARMAYDFASTELGSFPRKLHILRAVGAPGLGKSTFVNSAWSLLLLRLEEVEGDLERWLRWNHRAINAKELKKRLQSWKTSFGSLVFTIDMSNQCESD